MLAAAASWCLVLLASLYSVIWKKTVRGGKLRFIPAAIAATYPLTLLANISSTSKLVAGRATAFIFFAVAVVVGGWLASRLSRNRRLIERIVTIVVATVCFLGSLLYGGGPLPSYVPGPYLVGADERSVGPPSLAVSQWIATHLPADSRVAVDRDNGALLNDLGHVDPVTTTSGSANPAPLFFDRQLTPSDTALIRQDNIRYIVIDTRLTEALPLYGTYIAANETRAPTLLTRAELNKFNSIPRVRRIYDNGPIQVYDLGGILGKSPLVAPGGALYPVGGTGTDPTVLIVGLLVGGVWLFRLRRRSRRARISEHFVVCGIVGAMTIGLVGAVALTPTRLALGPSALVPLLALLALGLIPKSWRQRAPWIRPHRTTRSPTPDVSTAGRVEASPPGSVWTDATAKTASEAAISSRPSSGNKPDRTRRARTQIALGWTGLALFVFGASLSIAAARREWVPPPELSVVYGPAGRPVADVTLGSAGPISAQLEVVAGGHIRWSTPLAANPAPQDINLPAKIVGLGSQVRLVSRGHTLRQVNG